MSDNLYTPPSAPVSDHRGDSANDVRIREEHVQHEGSIRAFGILYYIGAAFLLIGAVGLFAGLTAGGGDDAGLEGSVLIGIAVGYLVFGVFMVWVGRGLRALKPSGRIPAIILAAIGLLGFPLGTLINGYLLYLLLSQKGQMVFSEEYAGVRARTP